MNKLFSASLVIFIMVAGLTMSSPAHAAIGFVERGAASDTPGLVSGLWHGMVAPYAVVLGLFINVGMYQTPNLGFLYDAGFLLGVAISLPVGWILAIISLVLLLL